MLIFIILLFWVSARICLHALMLKITSVFSKLAARNRLIMMM